MCIENAPGMKYAQAEGERACLPYLIASALHYAGARQLASEVKRMPYIITKRYNVLTYFIGMLRNHAKPLFFKELIANNWNILENVDNDMVVVLLQGSDQKEDQCVTLFGKWIFDSNLKSALPLSKESLDLCCSSDGNPVFLKVIKALLCTYYMNMIDKKSQK